MEPNEIGLTSHYHRPQQTQPLPQQSPSVTCTTATITATPTNGTLPPHMVYSHAAPSIVTPPSATEKKKRGRPRKYATPEEAAAAKKAMLASNPKKKKEQFVGRGDLFSFSSPYSVNTQLASPVVVNVGQGNVGQGFVAHILTVASGEDVQQKIMLFMQQSKCEICILSASGSIYNPSLRQSAPFGGNITYEGCFDILSLSGSYIHTELGGRSGGLSVCLSSADGQVIGGGIGGPCKAAGPVQVIVGTFQVDDIRKDVLSGTKEDDASFPKFQ